MVSFLGKLNFFIKYAILLCLLLAATQVNSQKVALVLSGGGARGVAHVGVLKALEENNIPVDYIVGTSMGAIIGGLYASGYSPQEIEEVIKSADFQNWARGSRSEVKTFLFKASKPDASWVSLSFDYVNTSNRFRSRLPAHLISPALIDFAMLELFGPASAASGYEFDSLMIPFRCVTADISADQAVVMRNGQLGNAIRASATYPFYYRPIKVDDKLMFDGGIYNNFPVDVALSEFNPDFIIGSKTVSVYRSLEMDDVISHIQNMIVRETGYELPESKGLVIEPTLPDINVIDFSRTTDLIDSGYTATIRIMPELKERIVRRSNFASVFEKRQAFLRKKPPVFIDSVSVEGLNKSQMKYVRNSFNYRSRYLTMDNVRKKYFKLLSDNKIRLIYPQIIYRPERNFYELNLDVTKAEHFMADFGGNLSSGAASAAYLGLKYNLLARFGFTAEANGYFGRFYSSARTSARIDFPAYVPYFVQGDFTYNHKDFFRNSVYFFEDVQPSYLICNESSMGLGVGMPASDIGILSGGVAAGYTKDQYYQTNQFTRTDTADITYFNFYTPYLTLEFNTLNFKQFPNKGFRLLFDLKYIDGKEKTIPGSTSVNKGEESLQPHQWLQFKVSYDNYFHMNRWLKLGISGEMLISNEDHFSNYTATLLRTPSFEPIPEMNTLFLMKYRATNYIALGVKPIFNLYKQLDFRLEGYGFQPYQEIEKEPDQSAVEKQYFTHRSYIWSATFVYYFPFTPVSLSFNYYDRAEDKFSVLFNIGFIIFNKSALN